jgi:hypothetical protein
VVQITVSRPVQRVPDASALALEGRERPSDERLRGCADSAAHREPQRPTARERERARGWRAVLWDQNAILVRRGFTEVGGDRLPTGQRVQSVPAAQQVLDLFQRLQALQIDPQPGRPRLPATQRHADGWVGAVPTVSPDS